MTYILYKQSLSGDNKKQIGKYKTFSAMKKGIEEDFCKNLFELGHEGCFIDEFKNLIYYVSWEIIE